MTREEAARLADSSAVDVHELEDGFRAEFADPTMRKEPFAGIGQTEAEARAVLAMSLAAFTVPTPGQGAVTPGSMPRSFDADGAVDEVVEDETAIPPPPQGLHRVFRAGAWEACTCEAAADHAEPPPET